INLRDRRRAGRLKEAEKLMGEQRQTLRRKPRQLRHQRRISLAVCRGASQTVSSIPGPTHCEGEKSCVKGRLFAR
ncbi:hypothetical protein KGG49_16495, partial [Klebsiella aerogenes]|uniref:hypothetical protein n=1 Tax=Klebsiella aerogenes TaxID=548 RepID=UPI001CC972DC